MRRLHLGDRKAARISAQLDAVRREITRRSGVWPAAIRSRAQHDG
jgi:hypothetical protein